MRFLRRRTSKTMQNKQEVMRRLLLSGAVNGLVAVALGAFGAHSLKHLLETNGKTEVYQTAAQYQMAHALALLLVALLSERFADAKAFRWIGGLFTIGIVFFSGSLYLLAITNVTYLGAITPLGGLCFLSAWALLIRAAGKERG